MAPSGSDVQAGVHEGRSGFFRWLRTDASSAAAHPDALARLMAGDLHGIVIDGVYGPEVLATVVERLERNEPGFLRTTFPAPFRSWFYGRNLNLAEPGLPGYFKESARFHGDLRALFAPHPDLETRVGELLTTLGGGRPAVAAPGPRPGEHYLFTTLRAHETGGYIPAHFDNEAALRPSYQHLATEIRPSLISFVLAFTRAQGGGALEVFDCVQDSSQAALMNDDRGARLDAGALASVQFRLAPGSLIVLDSGRYLHRVTPVEGPHRRWTACSFMALDRSGERLLCWG